MKLIIGLGNPGEEYENTRHNIGFLVLDKLAKELSISNLNWSKDNKNFAWIVKTADVIMAKPTTYMNSSGKAVANLANYYKIKPEDIIVVHDDIDLPLGKIRIRSQGGTAGHNGLNSILNSLKNDKFIRVRLGVGKSGIDDHEIRDRHTRHQRIIRYVLSAFTTHEKGDFRKLVNSGVEAVKLILLSGIDIAMNRFN